MRSFAEAMTLAGLRLDPGAARLIKVDNRPANLGMTPEMALATALLEQDPPDEIFRDWDRHTIPVDLDAVINLHIDDATHVARAGSFTADQWYQADWFSLVSGLPGWGGGDRDEDPRS